MAQIASRADFSPPQKTSGGARPVIGGIAIETIDLDMAKGPLSSASFRSLVLAGVHVEQEGLYIGQLYLSVDPDGRA
jgi:hypothetical protein